MPRVQHAKRAQRRAALKRQKAKARRLYPHDTRARNANNLTVCSCPMCGNPRRHFGNSHTRRIGELKSIDRMEFDLTDIE